MHQYLCYKVKKIKAFHSKFQKCLLYVSATGAVSLSENRRGEKKGVERQEKGGKGKRAANILR